MPPPLPTGRVAADRAVRHRHVTLSCRDAAAVLPAELPLIVLSVRPSAAGRANAAAIEFAELPLIVLSVTVRSPRL